MFPLVFSLDLVDDLERPYRLTGRPTGLDVILHEGRFPDLDQARGQLARWLAENPGSIFATG